MNDHCLPDDLSAYLDGEARDAEAVERHVRDCCQCAERLTELRQLSTLLHSMPAPEPRPEFVTHVVGRARETGVAAGSWFRWLVLPLGGAAIGAAACFVGFFLFSPAREEPKPVVNAHREAPVQAPAATEMVAEDDVEALPDNLLVAIADSPWFARLSQNWDEEDDLDSLIVTLDQTEAQTFKQLLRDYEQGTSCPDGQVANEAEPDNPSEPPRSQGEIENERPRETEDTLI